MNNCIAIIQARGGSKRIPRKNIKNFLGSPIIKYSIDAALQAGCFDEVMVSTEDHEIAEIALSLGAKVPFMRSQEASSDYAITDDVMNEVLNKYMEIGKKFTYGCGLYPTAPFVTAEKLRSAYNKLVESGAETLVPVVRFGFPILRSFKIEDALVKMNWPEYYSKRSQDLPPAFHDCGQFHFFRVDSYLKNRKMYTDFTVAFEMPESEVQDIDNEEDWKIAELKYRLLHEKKKNK